MQRGAKENFILLVLFLVLAAALLVVTTAILIGYFFVPPKHRISSGPMARAMIAKSRPRGRRHDRHHVRLRPRPPRPAHPWCRPSSHRESRPSAPRSQCPSYSTRIARRIEDHSTLSGAP